MESIESLFLLVLRASWHASIIVLIVIGLQWLFRRQLAANWRYLLWFAFLIRLALPTMPGSPLSVHNLSPNPFPIESAAISVPLQEPQISTTPSSKSLPELTTAAVKNLPSRAPERGAALSQPREPKPAVFSLPSLTQSLAFLWILVATGLILRLMIRATLFDRKVANSETNIPTDLENRFQTIKKALGLENHAIVLTLSQQVKSPCLFGFWRTRLIIPRSLAESLSGVELECVLLHELVHYKRHDILVSWVMSLLQYLHWFNPIVWFAMPRIRADREMATDAGVLQQANEQQRECYGELIIKLLDLLRKSAEAAAGSVAMVESKRHLQDRILAIARFSASHRTPLIGILVAIGTLLAFMLDASPTASEARTENEKPTTEMIVNVIDDTSKKPIAGSRVTVSSLVRDTETRQWLPNKEASTSQLTDSQGRANFVEIPSGNERYRVTASHEDFSTTSIHLDTAENPLPKEVDISLPDSNHISGVVTDPNGRPIPDVVVSIFYPFWPTFLEKGGSDLTTDSSGRWKCRIIPDDVDVVFASFQHSEYALEPGFLNNDTKYRCKQLNLTELPNRFDQTTLMKGSPFRGRIVDQNGLAITNAFIVINSTPRHENLKTDSNGAFVSEKSYTGRITGSISAKGYAPRGYTANVQYGIQDQTYTLSEGQPIRFRFVTSNGAPIEGVRMHPERAESFQIFSFFSYEGSNEEGLLEWKNAPSETVIFMFSSEDCYPVRSKALSTSESIHVIQLKRRLVVSVDAIDANGNPIPSFRVVQGTQSGGFTRWNLPSTVPGRNGKATFKDLMSFHYPPEIEWPKYVFRVEADGYMATQTRPVQISEENVALSVELQPSPTRVRRLVDDSGNPLPNKRLWLLSPHQACWVSAEKLSLEETQAEEIHTDESGRFTVPNRPDPHSILGLFEEGFLHQPLEDASVYSLKPWTALEGTWLENGHAMEGIKLGFGVWQSKEGSVLTHFADTATTNDQGKFSFNRVPVANARLCQILHSGPVTDYRWLKTVDVLPHTGTQITLNNPRLRTLHGRIEIPEHLKAKITPRPWHAMLEYDRPPLPAPQSVIQDPLKYRKWYQEWIQTEEGANYVAGRDESACLYVDDNGNFKTESIFPGKYRITFSYREKATKSAPMYSMPIIANVTRKIEITPNSPPEIDLGTFTLEELTPPTKKNVPDEL